MTADILIPPCVLKDAKQFIRESVLRNAGDLPRDSYGQYVPHDYWMQYIDNGEETFIRLELFDLFGYDTNRGLAHDLECYFGESNVAYA
jgi:hypothetical protein